MNIKDTPSIKLMKTLRESRQMPAGVISLELWAVWFGCSKADLWELVKSRRISHHMIGLRVLIDSRNLSPNVTPETGPEPSATPVEGLDLFGLLERYAVSRTNTQQATIDQMLYTITALNRCQGRSVLADELCEILIGRFARWGQAEGYAPSTIKRNLTYLSTLWKFASKRNLCRERFEPVDSIRVPKAIPRAWTLEELGRILMACRQLKGSMQDREGMRADWWGALVSFLYDTGARIGAAMSMRRSDIELDEGFAVLSERHAKTGVAQLVDISPDTIAILRRLLGSHSDELVWPGIKKRSRQLHLDFHKILASVGLDSTGVGFHRLRKTHATAVVSQLGWEAGRLALGHSDEAMTRRYVDPRQLPRVRLSLPRQVLDDAGNSPN